MDGDSATNDVKSAENNTSNDATTPTKETLVSDTCHEAFQGNPFEFSVAIDSAKTEEVNGEREITITTGSVQNELHLTTESERNTGEIVTEHVSNAMEQAIIVTESDKVVIVNEHHSTEQSANQSATTAESHEEKPTVEVTIDRPHEKLESTEQTTVDVIQQDTEISLEPGAVEEVLEQTVADDIHAQRGPSADHVIEVKPEEVILRPVKVSVDEPHMSISLSAGSDAAPTPTSDDQHVEEAAEKPIDAPETSAAISAEVSTKTENKEISKKKGLKKIPSFHFRVRRSPSNKEKRAKEKEVKEKEEKEHPETEAKHHFTDGMKNVFGSIKKGFRTKHKPERSHTIDHTIPPPRPPPVAVNAQPMRSKIYSSTGALDQQSLRSVSGPSISSSPELPKRKLIQTALPDLMAALPTDSMEREHNVNVSLDGNVHDDGDAAKQEAILAWTASQIAHPSSQGVIVEENIHAVHVERPMPRKPESTLINSISLKGDARSHGLPPKSNQAPKPPRPRSPPILSPLDYQAYHTEGSESGLVQRRMDMLQMMEPEMNMTQAELKRQNWQHEAKTASLQPGGRYTTSSMDSYSQCPTPTLRRTQTLKVGEELI